MDDDFELRWTRERARRTAWLHVLACAVGGGVSSLGSVCIGARLVVLDPEPSLGVLAAALGHMVGFFLAPCFLVLGNHAVNELHAADAGSLRLRARWLLGDDGACHRVDSATSASGRSTLRLQGGEQRVVSLDRRRHRALVRHLRGAGIRVTRGIGELEIVVGVPLIVGCAAVGAALVALAEASVTVGVLWLAASAPALLVGLLGVALAVAALGSRRGGRPGPTR